MSDVRKSLIPVVFSGGVDTKTTKQTVMPGKFLVLENCRRLKADKVRMRDGFQALGQQLSSGGSIVQGTALARFKDDVLIFGRDSTNTGEDRLYSYSPSNNNWLSRGSASTAVIDSIPIIRNSFKQSMPDVAVGGGFTLSVWQDSRGGARCSLIDNTTSSVIVYDQLLNNQASEVKCVYIGGKFVMVYRVAATLRSRTIDSMNPSVITTEVTALGSGVGSEPFDLVAASSDYALYVINTGSSIQYGYILDDGTIGNLSDGVPSPITTAVDGAAAVTIETDTTNQRLYIGAVNAAGLVTLLANNYVFNNEQTSTVETVSGGRNITIKVKPDFTAQCYYEIGATNTYDHYVKQTPLAWDGVGAITAISASVFKRSVGLASKAFVLEGDVYVSTSFETDLQPTYFVIRGDGLIVSRSLGGLGGGLTRNPAGTLQPGLCSAATASAEAIYVLFGVRLKLEAAEDNTILSTATGLNRIQVSVGTATYSTDTIGENLLIAGGTLLNYDGVSVTEHGFHVFPEEVTSSVNTGTGTFSGAGELGYQVTYEWVDARGQIHRSAPSVIQVVTLANATDEVELVIPKLRLTAKETNRASVRIVVYRTDVGGSTLYYKLREITNADNTAESNVTKTDDAVTYTDDNSDGVGLTSREILYTVGGTLENIAPPSSKVLARHQNRILLGDLEDETAVAYSREWVFGEGVNFSDGFLLRVDALGGKVTAIGSLDDKIILFKRDRLFAVTGDGPVDTGENNNFSTPTLISGDVGTTDPDSLVIMPDGLMFKSNKGYYLLSSSLQLQYIGADVEDYNQFATTGAVLMDDLNEVRFTTEDGPALVYNYFFRQWSVFTNYSANSCVIGLGSFLHLKADGQLNQEVIGQYSDNGQWIKMALETSWLSFAELQGFQRVYYIHGLGDFKSHHYAEIKLAYDFEQVYNQTAYYDTRNGVGTGVYGDTGPYGTGGYGGDVADTSTEWQWRMKPKRARCESVKVRIENIDTIESTPGACFEFVGLSFVVGTKRNGMRQPISRTIGSN